jgi:hypothetical protein
LQVPVFAGFLELKIVKFWYLIKGLKMSELALRVLDNYTAVQGMEKTADLLDWMHEKTLPITNRIPAWVPEGNVLLNFANRKAEEGLERAYKSRPATMLRRRFRKELGFPVSPMYGLEGLPDLRVRHYTEPGGYMPLAMQKLVARAERGHGLNRQFRDQALKDVKGRMAPADAAGVQQAPFHNIVKEQAAAKVQPLKDKMKKVFKPFSRAA